MSIPTTVPYTLTRVGVVMTPEPGNPLEAAGVLNPGSGRTPDGRLHLLPRVVADGNVSRVGLAEVVLRDGVPVGVQRRGIVLAPDEGWERGAGNAGVEDPRVTWVPSLGQHVMTYVAFGPLGPRLALAVSDDLEQWRRLGPVQFTYQPDLDTDLCLFPNKDAVFFPEPVPDPDGRMCFAMLHRPMWDLGWLRPGETEHLPAGVSDPRPGIWISYIPVELALADVRALTRPEKHRLLAMPEFAFEELKIGAGPPPLRVDEGWLLIHHGVIGQIPVGFDPTTQKVEYAAGAMLLDAGDPSRVIARTGTPLLAPLTAEERDGVVSNVVFPTAIECIDGVRYVFYGMADAKIGVARLDHTAHPRACEDNMTQAAPEPVVRPSEQVDKPWGHEEIFALVEGAYVGKLLFVSAGESLSLQYHHAKDETIALVSGKVEIDLGTSADTLRAVPMTPGDSVHVLPGVLHRLRAVEDSVLVEASTADAGWRQDVVRLEDRYGRLGTTAP